MGTCGVIIITTPDNQTVICLFVQFQLWWYREISAWCTRGTIHLYPWTGQWTGLDGGHIRVDCLPLMSLLWQLQVVVDDI